jgi:tetratricopeptide (TPR) repeat protein
MVYNLFKLLDDKSKIVLLTLVVFTVGFLVYANTLNFGLSYLDDNNHIHTLAKDYDSKTAVIDVFKNNLLFGRSPTLYYRPMVAVSFILEHKIAGESESFSHFGSVMLHCISCVLVFLFLKKYLFKTTTSFLAALLFAVHPIGIHTVTWIPGRNDSIMLINFILSLAFFIEYIDKKKLYMLAGHIIFTFFCFCSKESGLILIPIFIFYYVTHKDINTHSLKKLKSDKSMLLLIILWIAAACFFLKLRSDVFPGHAGISENLLLSKLFSSDNINMIFDYYSAIFFFRTSFAALWEKATFQIYLMGSLSILLTAFFSFYRKDFHEKIKMSFYFLLPFILLFPTNLAGGRLWFQGNRMYIPLFAIIVTLFSFLTYYIENKKTRTGLISLILIVIFLCLPITTKASYKFKNSIAFWGNVINESSYTNITAIKFHGYSLMQNGRFQEAINELLPLANSLKFNYDELNYALGSAFILNKDYINAAQIFEMMIQKRQMLIPQVYARLILALHFLGNTEKENYYLNEFIKATNSDQSTVIAYLNNLNNFINTERQTNLSRPKTI